MIYKTFVFWRGFIYGSAATTVLASSLVYLKFNMLSWKKIIFNESLSEFQDNFKYGIPEKAPDILVYENHAVGYDFQKRIPIWVAEVIHKSKLKGNANRRKSKFLPDLQHIGKMYSSFNEDFSHSGWSRGHMAPAADSKYSQHAMDESFLLTNVLPQDRDNNSGFWNRFEMFCRDLAFVFDSVHVVSGPLFLPHAEGDKNFIKYQVIGKSQVAVPSYLFKAIVVERQGKTLYGAFVVPNVPISSEHGLDEFQVPLEVLESRAGLQLFPTLDRRTSHDLCVSHTCFLKPLPDFSKPRTAAMSGG